MIGYCSGGYKICDEDKNRIVAARNIIFDERLNKQEEEVSISSKPIEESDNDMDESRDQENDEGKENIEEEIISRNKLEIEDIEKREQRVKQKPKWQQDYVMDFNQEDSEVLFALQVSQLDDVPLNYEDIESRKDKQLWRKAVEEEMKVLKESDTWEIEIKRIMKEKKILKKK
ncbi:hypothetical protein QE152_g33343 [Popillia japonica]|uniref:Uncharacterized protein n=1 Tax=Popillia japonica TaxID=7064 RepID=A0AAW1IX03_POPJA